MIHTLLNKPALYFYGKANSGKTITLLKINEVLSPFYKEVHFFSPNRASYYQSIIKQDNVTVHTVTNGDKLISKLSSLNKCSLVIIDDITIISNVEAWKNTNKVIQGLGFRKLLVSMEANPNFLNASQNLPVIRCEQVDSNVILYCQDERMPLKDTLVFLNRNLTLDDYCGSM